LNAYIPLLVVSLMARFTNLITLKPPYDTLTSWWIIGLLILLSIVEFLVDKFPVVNHINDFIIQTFIRPAAGAIVVAASTDVISGVHPVLALALGLLVAGSVHAVKSTTIRPAVTAATGGAGNIPVSLAEEATSTTVSVLSILVPAAAAVIITLFFTWAFWHLFLRQSRKKDAK
jgi:cytochrome c oxidase subunit IV